MMAANGILDDEQMVRYLDGAMAPEERRIFEARLRQEPVLGRRLADMSAGTRPFLQAFEALLSEAPLDRLASRISPPPSRPVGASVDHAWLRPARIAAAFLIFVLGAASAFVGYRYLPSHPEETEEVGEAAWRSTVAEYLALTTSLTLSETGGDAPTMAADLARVSARLGLPLSLDLLQLSGRSIRRIGLYEIDGVPLLQIAYLDPDNGPIAFCILARPEAPRGPAVERRGDMNVVHWSSGRHAFMLAGRAPKEVLEPVAETLLKRVS
jgi:anti-sigma factor RsiW